MVKRSIFVHGIVLISMATAGLAASVSAWQKEEPSQWTSEDVYQILNNSAWSKSTSVTFARNAGYGDPSTGGNNGTWGNGNGGGMPGGMGRGGMGTGGMGGGMGGGGINGGGMGRNRSGYPAEQPLTATVQWQSALPVRLAEVKLSNGTPDAAAMKPLNEYVIAVTGLPKSGLNSQMSSSNNPNDYPDDDRMAEHLKVVTVLTVGHERLNPTKVELNQGRDGRTVFHFEKSEPITLKDKNVEFRITTDRMELRERFNLKDMQYEGNLAL